MSARPYQMQRRQVAMDETRAKIIRAARTVLVSGAPFSLDAVAREAGVARLTVYDRFGSREGLLEAIFDDLAESGGLTALPEAFTQADPVEALERFVAIFCGFYSAHRLLLRRLDALAVLGRGAAGKGDRNPRRLEGLHVLLNRLAAAGHADAGSADMLHAVHALTSFAFVDEFAGIDADPMEMAPRISALIKEIAHLRS
jgi:AcrR family transcriptional regulator